MKESSRDFRRRKWTLALRIVGAGIIVAWLWALWARFVLHEDFPYNTILGNPAGRFADFTDDTIFANLPNPYADPTAVYAPAAVVLFRALSFSDEISLIIVFFCSITAFALLLTRLLEPIFTGAWFRVAVAFLFLALSYPLLHCLDRGNIEIIMAALLGWSLYFYSRQRDLAGTACLLPAICLKFYPAIFLVLLLRKGKTGLAAATLLTAAVVVLASAACFPAPASEIWASYRQNLVFFTDFYFLDNPALDGPASLWNAYKVILIVLQHGGLIPPFVFGFSGGLIRTSFAIYSTVFTLFSLLCIGYAWLAERHQARGSLMLLLLMSLSVPSGSDYRLIYASMALVLLIVLPTPRRGDWLALVLIAFAVIPKKEVLRTFIGEVNTGYTHVSLQVVLSPLCLLAAMLILLYQSSPWNRGQALRRLLFSFSALRFLLA
jgi:hypothetical protein